MSHPSEGSDFDPTEESVLDSAEESTLDAASDGRVANPGRTSRFTRREVMAGLGGGAILSSSTTAYADDRDHSGSDAAVRVRVYPGTLPAYAWLRYGFRGARSGWPRPYEDAFDAVDDAFSQLGAYVETQYPGLEELDVTLERAAPLDLSLSPASTPSDVISPSPETIFDAFRDRVHDRGAVTGSTCHLLLWWGPTDFRLGYGGTRSPNTHVARESEEGSQTVANVGATELWDSRAVTKNIAIHEALHTFLSPSVVETVIDSRCDHDLGTAVRTDERTLEVSPMATAYAGPDELGGGTRFHGTGCYDHDSFAQHDGYEGVDRWEYTTTLSDATLEALARYVERNLA